MEKNSAIAEDVFNYIKAYLNDIQIEGGQVEGITTALGYYFVDVKYNISAAKAGEFKDIATLVGLRGAFKEDLLTGEIIKNDGFLAAAVEAGNKYFLENKIEKHLEYNDNTLFVVADGYPSGSNDGFTTDISESAVADENIEDTGVDAGDSEQLDNSEDITDDTEVSSETEDNIGETEQSEAVTDDTEEVQEDTDNVSDEDTGDVLDENTEETSNENTEETSNDNAQSDGDTSNTDGLIADSTYEYDGSNRKAKFDVRYINSIVGASAENTIEMPTLSMVYNIPENSGTASGAGIYPCGIGGMKLFGYNRENIGGDITLRYVFKESDDGSGEISNVNIYAKELNTEIPQFATDSNVLIPEYLEQEFETLLERADRAIANCDLTAMMAGDIFDDIGFAILRGYYKNSTDILKHMSVVRQVIARDINNKAYILEIETTTVEGAKSSNTQGTYRDKSYIVVQQFGSDFKITDWVRVSRSMVDEPDIDAGNSTLKRITALNLTGEVSEENKVEAEKLLNELYTASTNRYLYGPYEIENSDGTVEEHSRGMYDCFNDDTTLLRSDKKEEMNSRIRSYLTAYGTGVSCEYIGKVDEWIGGYKNQIEFTTEEIMVYGDKQAARYFRTYYLMSNMNDTWYIDEMKVLDTEELDAGDIDSYYSRIKSN